jgi:hypothetical protein
MNMVDLDGKKVLVRPSQAESTKGKEVIIGEERPPMIIKPKSPKDDQWQKNEGGKPQRRPKATFDILMAKYKEGRVGIRGHKNRTIRNTKPDNLVSLSHASTSTTRSSSGKRSQTPPRQNSEGQDRYQQDYLLVPYFSIGPPMPGAWGPSPMIIHLVLLGGVVWAMDATADALPSGMVKACSEFWTWRLSCRRWPLQTRRPLAGQGSPRTGKLDSLKCQTGPSGFLGDNSSSWSPA